MSMLKCTIVSRTQCTLPACRATFHCVTFLSLAVLGPEHSSLEHPPLWGPMVPTATLAPQAGTAWAALGSSLSAFPH